MRLSWQETLMNMAIELSKRSTCCRIKVGAILVRDQRIISMGYNGVPKGKVHCEEHFKDTIKDEKFFLDHQEWSTQREIHAEMNLVLFSAKYGIRTDDTEIYTTHSPCIHCAKALLQAGIKKVYYKEVYRNGDGLEFLTNNGVECNEV